jgi:hypothetical protein
MPDPRWELASGYRIDPFTEQDAVSGEDAVALWTNEGVLALAEAQRRVAEILLVSTDSRRRLAGICTTYLQRNEQLRAELWHYRTYVAAGHRQFNIAVALALAGRDHLVRRYVRGEDRRGIGIIFEVENEGLQRHFPEARWMPTDFLFIGENDLGAHVRVHYFPGALAPEPDQGSA